MQKRFSEVGLILSIWMILLAATILPATAAASDFRMKDGSFIKGELEEEPIKVVASQGIGEVTLNPKDILSIVSGEKTEIRLRDGSLIKGEIAGEGLKVKTSFGELKIDPKALARYEAAGEGQPAVQPAGERAKEGEESAGEEAPECGTYDLSFNTVWGAVSSVLSGMGEKTEKESRDAGQLTTRFREYTDAKSLAAAGYKPGQVQHSLQVFLIGLAEGKTKVTLNASFKKAKMKILSEEIGFPQGLKHLRQAFFTALAKALAP